MGHHHHHTAKNLQTAFFLNLAFTIFEIIGGLYANSVAILSDAVHDLGDSLSLGVSWYLQRKSRQGPTQRFSFGYRRFSLFGALVNSLVLIGGSIYVVSEAVERLIHPESSNANSMLLFAIIGVLVNGYAAYKLSSGKSLNEKVVSWHLIEDVLGWCAVLVVAIILQFKDIPYLDPALSLLITAYVLYNVIKRLRETLFLFLQGTPEDISLESLEQKILSLEHMESLHHTHIWSLDGEKHVFTTHLKLENNISLPQLLKLKKEVKGILSNYPFSHYTIETELPEEPCGLADDDEG